MAKTETEAECFEDIQDALGVIKARLQLMQKINTDADRLEVANSCYMFGGKVTTLHGEMMQEVHRLWPEAVAKPLQKRGGGDR